MPTTSPKLLEGTRTLLPIASLQPHPAQADNFDDCPDAADAAFQDDIAKVGMQHPIEIMPAGNRAGLPAGTIIAGHRRRVAAQALGWNDVPVIIRNDLMDADSNTIEAALIADNLHRRQLNNLEKARAVRRLYEIEKKRPRGTMRRTDQEEARDRVGKLVGWSGRTLSRYWSVLECPKEVQLALLTKQLKLVMAARVATLHSDVQQELASEISGVANAADVRRIVQRYLGDDEAGDSELAIGQLLTRLIRHLYRGLRGLEARIDEVTSDDLTGDEDILRRTHQLTKQLIKRCKK